MSNLFKYLRQLNIQTHQTCQKYQKTFTPTHIKHTKPYQIKPTHINTSHIPTMSAYIQTKHNTHDTHYQTQSNIPKHPTYQNDQTPFKQHIAHTPNNIKYIQHV